MARSRVRAWVAAGVAWDRVRRRWRWSAPAVAVLLVGSLVVSVPSRAVAEPVVPAGARTSAPAEPQRAVEDLGPTSTQTSQGARGPGVPADPPAAPAPRFDPEPEPVAAALGLRVPATPSRIDALKLAQEFDRPTEDWAARTSNSTELVNPDGTITRVMFEGTAFVPDPDSPQGWLRPLSTVLERAADGSWVPRAASDSRFAGSADANVLAQVALPEGRGTVGFAVTGAAPVAGVPDKDGVRLRYPGIVPGTDLFVAATAEGVKDEIVLASASAPRVFEFPLMLPAGVTPRLGDDGGVLLVDDAGTAIGSVRAPFMYDSSLDPVAGEPAYSMKVTYALAQTRADGLPLSGGDGATQVAAGGAAVGRVAVRWVLRMTLDEAWLADPARVWPVTVDPMIGWVGVLADDAFVSSSDYAWSNTSGLDNLVVGTWNGGGEKRQSYLHFDLAPLSGMTVASAKLRLVNYWSFNCDDTEPVTVHEVTTNWSGSALGAYPGPAFNPTSLASVRFAHGWTACPSPAWVEFPLPAATVAGWVANPSSFKGLTLRASDTNSLAWKRFRSQNYSDASQRPRLEVTYSNPIGLTAASPDSGSQVGTLTPTLWVNPTINPGVQAKFHVCVSPSVCYDSPVGGTRFEVPAGWIPTWGTQVTWYVSLKDGDYVSDWSDPFTFVTQVPQPPVTSHLAGAADGAEIAGVNPQVGNYTTGVTDVKIPVAGPELAATRSYNSQDPRTDGAFGPGWSTPWDQKVQADADGSGNAVVTLASGLQLRFGLNPDGTYAPPLGQRLDLVRDWVSGAWTLRDASGFKRVFTPDGRLDKIIDADGREQVFGYPSGTGNVALGSAATGTGLGACFPGQTPDKAVNGTILDNNDKWCTTLPGKWLQVDLGQVRTISSAVVKHAGAGGETTAWNTRDFTIMASVDGSSWTQVVNVTGNTSSISSHSFTAVPARYVRLDIVTPTQTTDTAARIFQFEVYGTGRPTSVTDGASGRTLTLQWMNGRIDSVTTDAPETGQAGYTWSYGYDPTGRLTSVCSPLDAAHCTTYTYEASSHYRTVVEDDQPPGYWPLSETSGTVANNVMAQKPGQYDGTYTDLTLNQAGAVQGSPDPAVSFPSGVSGRVLDLPRHLINSTVRESVELWFQAPTSSTGMLISEMAGPVTSTSGQDSAVLYVGTDGKLRGQFFTTAGVTPVYQMSSPSRVDDGLWHHAVITIDSNNQHLYLDGVHIGQILDQPIDHVAMSYLHIGNGWVASPWPQIPAAGPQAFPFTGSIDEVAYYRYPLAASQVVEHYAARAGSQRLTRVSEPGAGDTTVLTYHHDTGRVDTATDRNGAQWTVGQPVTGTDTRSVTLNWPGHRQITYTYDTAHNGRLSSRTEPYPGLSPDPTRTWAYDPQTGFVSAVSDENGDTTWYQTDARGNVTAQTRCALPTETPLSTPPGASCYTSYAGYYLNTNDPLDPRNDQVIWQADARSADAGDTTFRTTRDLDSAGRVTTITYPPPAGQTTNPVETYTYTTIADGVPGLVKTHTTPTATGTATTTNTYNEYGDLRTQTDAVGLVTTYDYDNLGRVKSVNQSATVGGALVDYGTTTTQYNALSIPVVITEPGVLNPVSSVTHTRRITTQVDPATGLTLSVTVADLTGGDPSRTTTFEYDTRGRLHETTNADNTTVLQTWDEAGDLVSTTQSTGLTTRQEFDQAHRLLRSIATGANVDPLDPGATTLRLRERSYDPAGRLGSEIDAGGHETRYQYGSDDLQTKVLRIRTSPLPSLVAEQRDYTDGLLTTATIGGRVTTYAYDPAGNVATQHVDPTGVDRATSYTYFADGSLATASATGVQSPGRTEKVSYANDAAGRLEASTVDKAGETPSALTTHYTRDPRGLVIATQDPSGVTTTTTYDLAGRISTVTGAARTTWVGEVSTPDVTPVVTFGYDTFGNQTQVKDPSGQVTAATYDSMDRPTSTTLPNYTPPGGTTITATTQTHYTNGLPDTVTDPLGNVTTYQYDPYGRLTLRTDPDPDGSSGPKASPVWTYSYTQTGQLDVATDPTGAYTDNHYNDLDQLDEGCVSEDHHAYCYPTTYEYNDAGDVRAVIAPSTTVGQPGARTEVAYNGAGDKTRVTDPTGRFTEFSYDLAGRVIATATGRRLDSSDTYLGPTRTTTYDLAGRATSTAVCSITTPITCATTQYTYDAADRLLKTVSPEGRPTTYAYDTAGQLTTITQWADRDDDDTAATVTLGYDAAGNTTRMVDGNDHATSYYYNTWGLPERTVEPSTTAHPSPADRTWVTSYNALGQPSVQQLPGGVLRTATYDNLGRLTQETGTGAEGATTDRALDYDPLGRITSATSPAGNLTYTWTDRGLLATATGYGGTAQYRYNSIGALTQRVDPAGTAVFDYDDAGRLTSVTDPLTGTTTSNSYDDAGRLTTVGRGAGYAGQTLHYDNLGRVDSDTVTAPGGATPVVTTYQHDLDGLLLQKTTTGVAGAGLNEYEYDDMARVTSWLSPAGTTTSYQYDKASNRTHVVTPAGDRVATYDDRNRVQTVSGADQPDTTYTWNARGQLTGVTVTGGDTRSYTYDAFERLVGITGSAIPTTTYGYDSLDRVAQRNTAKFGYNDLSNNPVLDPSGLGETTLLRDPAGNAIASKDGTDPGQLLRTDALHGDITAALNPTTGVPASSASYDPWGTPTTAGDDLPIGYQGGYTDPDTGLVNAHARWYDPELAAFTSRDTWTLTPVPLPQANRYLYANGSPLTATDTSGHIAARTLDTGDTRSAFVIDIADWSKCPDSACRRDVAGRISSAKKQLEAERRALPGFAAGCRGNKECIAQLGPAPGQAIYQNGSFTFVTDDNKVVTMTPRALLDAQKAQAEQEAKQKAERERCQASFICRNAGTIGNVVGIAVGVIVGAACTIGTAGAAVVGCAAIAGFAGGFYGSLTTTFLADPHAGIIGALQKAAVAGLIGAVGGAIGGAIGGKVAGAVINKLGGGLLSRIVAGGVSGAVSGAPAGAFTGGAFAAYDYLSNCGDSCDLSDGLNATQDGAKHGAIGGAIAGLAFGATLGAFTRGCHSFTPETRVAMADGTTKAIKDVQPGDHVLATDPVAGTTTARTVTAHHINHDNDLTDLKITTTGPPTSTTNAGTATVGAAITTTARPAAVAEAAAAAGAVTALIHTTAHHDFWDQTTQSWTPAAQLEPGDALRTPDGTSAVVADVRPVAGEQDMHDLTVDTVHTYYVLAGNTPVLVHNTQSCGPGLKEFPDVSNLRGGDPDDLLDVIPDHWTVSTPAKVPPGGDSIRFSNPNAPGQSIIYESGWPGADTPIHSGPYLRISDGTQPPYRIPLRGNPQIMLDEMREQGLL